MNKIESAVLKLAEPVAKEQGCYIYDIQFVKEGTSKILRVFADRDGGIGVDECEKISRSLSDILDENDPIDGNYFLEVSSPGIERRLTYDWHFEKYNMCEVDVSLYSAQNGSKKLKGLLKSATGDDIVIISGDNEIILNKKNIAAVSLHYDF